MKMRQHVLLSGYWHTPAEHEFEAQWMPQPPQLFASVWKLGVPRHESPHRVYPVLQEITQAPALQPPVVPLATEPGQALLQEPQLFVSVLRLKQPAVGYAYWHAVSP